MCRHDSSAGDAVSIEENLLIYCKPVELYNILRPRSLHNPLFLRRCLRYKIQAKHKRRFNAGTVIFNYRDYSNILQKTEVTEDFTCPFCLMQCASFKGLRYHLCSSHDLFNFEFWVTGEYQAVNVSVKTDALRSESVAEGAGPQLQTFFFCSRPKKRRSLNYDQNTKHVTVQFLEFDSCILTSEGAQKGLSVNGNVLSYNGEKAPGLLPSGLDMQNGRQGQEIYGPYNSRLRESIENGTSSSSAPGVPIAGTQSSLEPNWVKLQSGSDCAPAKLRKLNGERSDPKNRMLLQKRQFYHSHRVQPMELEQVLSDMDSEDEVDDDIADLEDRRMLDDFVDVTKDEKQLMHLWNSFGRRQSVLADAHVPWACEAFSRLHGQELISSPALFWCWRLFMIKLWNHGLLDACTMNSCNAILNDCKK
ncbi:polycomb group protein EMBRYONIC FLOWER 2-like isoform X2 [Argentina anserina]|uniref:polycomb group protein EMBRYONIC FLOWER 2-like isoform X2 n=1 Tax=Argentina anserina TaxID=57926 RepID=UPI00217691AA|nr:polycomb group protein EMBRYONIC FLOWER 2-like isoform X2 [Potentilla anserina]